MRPFKDTHTPDLFAWTVAHMAPPPAVKTLVEEKPAPKGLAVEKAKTSVDTKLGIDGKADFFKTHFHFGSMPSPVEKPGSPEPKPEATAKKEPTVPAPGPTIIKEKREEPPAPSNRANYNAAGVSSPSTPAKIVEANTRAIVTLKTLEKEKRLPTSQEIADMAAYQGWGNCAKFFDNKYHLQNSRFHTAFKLDEYKTLASMLTDEEMSSLSATVTTAFFTPAWLAGLMWRMITKAGFKGGRVLEPSAGTGSFIHNMPQTDIMMEKTRISAVEMDGLTNAILAATCPACETHNIPFQEFKSGPVFDAIIGNVPFSPVKPYDPAYQKYKFSLHDYFFAKCYDLLKPGGVMALVSSTCTLDKSGVPHYIHGKGGELLAAFRLPEGVFATTETSADVIVIGKNTRTAENADWLENCQIQVANGHFNQNKYFEKHPENVLGRLEIAYRGRSSRLSCVGDNAEILLAKRIGSEGFRMAKPPAATPLALTIEKTAREEKRGKKHQELNRIADRLAAAAKGLLVRSSQTTDEEELKQLQQNLATEYDLFVFSHGPIHENLKYLRENPELPNLLALEKYDRDEKKAEKADIFTKRVLSPRHRPESADTLHDAMWISINDTGRIEPGRMAGLTGKTAREIESALDESPDAFLNPETLEWETKSEYISGRVKDKLFVAQKAAETDTRFEKNRRELAEAVPAVIPFEKIKIRPGATWIPEDCVEAFLENLTDSRPDSFKVTHTTLGNWIVEKTGWIPSSIKNDSQYGCPEFKAHELFTKLLNSQLIKIYVETIDGKKQLDQQATALANEKASQIETYFAEWLGEDEERRSRLEKIYNDTFNAEIPRQYHCPRLDLPGMSDTWAARLNSPDRQYQRDAIYRGVHGNNTLLAHCVGAGKTLEMCAIGMERKRLGIIKKPMYVVPNHMLEQWGREFKEIYPDSKVKIMYKEEMAGDKRKVALSKIAIEDFDAVIMAHSTFSLVKMSDEFEKSYIREQMNELEIVLRTVNKEDGNYKTRKQLEKSLSALKEKLKKYTASEKKDAHIDFEMLNVDQLFVDEAHNFKGIPLHTNRGSVSGIQIQTSQRASNMEMKVQYVSRLHDGKSGVVFATGTPISNSISEAYVMLKYLDPQGLADKGIQCFDDWANNFGKIVTELEIKPTGAGYRLNSRFCSFSNLPELKQMFFKFADVIRAEDIDIPKPRLAGGKTHGVECHMTEEQHAYIEELVERSEKIAKGNIDPSEDNILKITGEAMKIALSAKLMDIDAEHEQSKLNMAAKYIHKLWAKHKNKKATQCVFCDHGVPGGGKTYNVYDDIKGKLVAKGIPEGEIAFIHDAANDFDKAEIFAKVRKGTVRVIIGNTAKMGEGTNFQDLIIANHQLDAPWKPAHYEQRWGRSQRPGNKNKYVWHFNYISMKSFDAYKWQTIERKAKAIHAFLSPSMHERELEGDATSFTAAEMKAIASDNPIIQEKIMLELTMQKLQTKLGTEAYDRLQQKKNLARLEYDLRELKKTEETYNLLANTWARESEKGFTLARGGKILAETSQLAEDCVALAMMAQNRPAHALTLNDTIKIYVRECFEGPVLTLEECGESVKLSNIHKKAESNQLVASNIKGALGRLADKTGRITMEIKTKTEQRDKFMVSMDNAPQTPTEKEILEIRKRLMQIDHELKLDENDIQAEALPESGEDAGEGRAA